MKGIDEMKHAIIRHCFSQRKCGSPLCHSNLYDLTAPAYPVLQSLVLSLCVLGKDRTQPQPSKKRMAEATVHPRDTDTIGGEHEWSEDKVISARHVHGFLHSPWGERLYTSPRRLTISLWILSPIFPCVFSICGHDGLPKNVEADGAGRHGTAGERAAAVTKGPDLLE